MFDDDKDMTNDDGYPEYEDDYYDDDFDDDDFDDDWDNDNEDW